MLGPIIISVLYWVQSQTQLLHQYHIRQTIKPNLSSELYRTAKNLVLVFVFSVPDILSQPPTDKAVFNEYSYIQMYSNIFEQMYSLNKYALDF